MNDAIPLRELIDYHPRVGLGRLSAPTVVFAELCRSLMSFYANGRVYDPVVDDDEYMEAISFWEQVLPGFNAMELVQLAESEIKVWAFHHDLMSNNPKPYTALHGIWVPRYKRMYADSRYIPYFERDIDTLMADKYLAHGIDADLSDSLSS